ncbi:hypothetical protein HPG69_012837, partial [Diceros bicornis minor]
KQGMNLIWRRLPNKHWQNESTGTMIWSSPVQQSRIMHLATLPHTHLAFIVDLERTLKVWNCQDEDALATRITPRACFSLEACLTKDGPFLMVSWHSEGDIYTLTVPGLRNVSKVNVFKYNVDLLHCSPDRKWIFASTHQHHLPKVGAALCASTLGREGQALGSLLTETVRRRNPSVSLPLSSCCRAYWAPRRINRITLMFRRGSSQETGFTTYDLATERTEGRTVIQAHQITSFLLPVDMESPICMGVSDGNMFVFESRPYLFLFTISGLLLQQFEDHQRTISNLWVVCMTLLLSLLIALTLTLSHSPLGIL